MLLEVRCRFQRICLGYHVLVVWHGSSLFSFTWHNFWYECVWILNPGSVWQRSILTINLLFKCLYILYAQLIMSISVLAGIRFGRPPPVLSLREGFHETKAHQSRRLHTGMRHFYSWRHHKIDIFAWKKRKYIKTYVGTAVNSARICLVLN